MKPTTLTALAFATTAMLSSTSTLAAEQVHTYNGSVCNPYYGNQTSQFYHSTSGITNNSTTSNLWITCPAMVTDGFINKGARVWAYWTNQYNRNNDRIDCHFYSLRSGGQAVTSRSSCAIGTGWLLPGSTNAPCKNGTPGVTPSFVIGAGQDDASYAMICGLPPGGTLNAIQVNEIL